MLKSKNISFSLVWIVATVILFFTGLVLAVTSTWTGTKNLGTIIWVSSLVSMLAYLFYSAFLWFKFKKGNAWNNFVTAYIILAFLITLGGLVGAFLTYPQGMKTFLIGLGMFGGYWLFKLVGFMFSKESDFE